MDRPRWPAATVEEARALLMVVSSFLGFVPLFLTTAFAFSGSQAAFGGTLWGMGGLAATTLGATIYNTYNASTQRRLTAGCLAMSTVAAVVFLAHAASILTYHQVVASGLLLLLGFGVSLPFYIPSNVSTVYSSPVLGTQPLA